MDNKEYAKVVAKNLKRLAFEKEITQNDIVKHFGMSKATVSSWFNGTRAPRMDKIDMLCDYFQCNRSDIMEEYIQNNRESTNSDEARLLDAYRKADPITRRNIRMLLGIDVRMNSIDKIG